MDSIEYTHTPDISIGEFDGEKPYLALQISFSEDFEGQIIRIICLILIEKSTGIVYCIYPLTVDNADPVFYDATNPQNVPTTTNIFNNIEELNSFGDLHLNPYSQFYKISRDLDNLGDFYGLFNPLYPYEDELEHLSTRIGNVINEIDYNLTEDFCKLDEISLHIVNYNGKYITNFIFGFEEVSSGSLSPIEVIRSPEAFDGKKKSKKRSKKRSKRRSKKRSKRRSKKSKRRSKKRSKRN